MSDLDLAVTVEYDYEPGQFREQQLVRMDGSVLVSLICPPGQRVRWEPYPGEHTGGPCAGRVRVLPDGPWLVLAYFPEGWPGPAGAWPEDGELGGARTAISPG